MSKRFIDFGDYLLNRSEIEVLTLRCEESNKSDLLEYWWIINMKSGKEYVTGSHVIPAANLIDRQQAVLQDLNAE